MCFKLDASNQPVPASGQYAGMFRGLPAALLNRMPSLPPPVAMNSTPPLSSASRIAASEP
jgi:hypothetical protein